MDNKNLVFLDFETTGLEMGEDHRITQIAAKILRKNYNVQQSILNKKPVYDLVEHEYCSFVNPNRDIPHYVQNLTGITNELVKDAPSEKEVIDEFVKLIGNFEDVIIIAHHAPFDLGFLHYALLRNGHDPYNFNFYCTRTMVAVLFPTLSHSLGNIIKLFDIDLTKAHDAKFDVEAMCKLFYKVKHIADLFGLDFLNKVVLHPDKDLLFQPLNSTIISLK